MEEVDGADLSMEPVGCPVCAELIVNVDGTVSAKLLCSERTGGVSGTKGKQNEPPPPPAERAVPSPSPACAQVFSRTPGRKRKASTRLQDFDNGGAFPSIRSQNHRELLSNRSDDSRNDYTNGVEVIPTDTPTSDVLMRTRTFPDRGGITGEGPGASADSLEIPPPELDLKTMQKLVAIHCCEAVARRHYGKRKFWQMLPESVRQAYKGEAQTIKRLADKVEVKKEMVQEEASPQSHAPPPKSSRSPPQSYAHLAGVEMISRCKRVLAAVRKAKSPEGYHYAAPFELLPSSKELPIYYKVIPSPVDLRSVAAALKKKMGYTLFEFTIDMSLVWTNARLFNEVGSQIYIDSKSLEEVFAREMEAQFSGVPMIADPYDEVEREEKRRWHKKVAVPTNERSRTGGFKEKGRERVDKWEEEREGPGPNGINRLKLKGGDDRLIEFEMIGLSVELAVSLEELVTVRLMWVERNPNTQSVRRFFCIDGSIYKSPTLTADGWLENGVERGNGRLDGGVQTHQSNGDGCHAIPPVVGRGIACPTVSSFSDVLMNENLLLSRQACKKRCAVCAVAKKGRCGSLFAPVRCLVRVAEGTAHLGTYTKAKKEKKGDYYPPQIAIKVEDLAHGGSEDLSRTGRKRTASIRLHNCVEDMEESPSKRQPAPQRKKSCTSLGYSQEQRSSTPRKSEAPPRRFADFSKPAQLIDRLDGNREPVLGGPWRLEPTPQVEYERIQSVDFTEITTEAERASVMGKFSSKLNDNCDEVWKAMSVTIHLQDTAFEKLNCSLEDETDSLYLERLRQAPLPVDEHKREVEERILASARNDVEVSVDGLQEKFLFGLDCYSRRAVQLGLMTLGMSSTAEQTFFIERYMLTSMVRVGDDGWNLIKVLQDVKSVAERKRGECELRGDDGGVNEHERIAKLSIDLTQLMIETERLYLEALPPLEAKLQLDTVSAPEDIAKTFLHFRGHPKGVGVICTRTEGIPAHTFLGHFVGELYTPWRWFEVQDVIKKCTPKGQLPDFYNLLIERPRNDPAGYDVTFIDASRKGNFLSRLSHSCSPNCVITPICAGGKLQIVLVTTRDIQENEELTWDYSCVTESIEEYRKAVCLCGCVQCQGSFLQYAGSSTFTDYILQNHTFLDRSSLLLTSCHEQFTDEDHRVLDSEGIRSSILSFSDGEEIPVWLKKWIADTLRVLKSEQEALPALLMRRKGKSQIRGLTEDIAKLEAEGIAESRLQTLTVSLDKVKYALSNFPIGQRNKPPFAYLDDAEITKLLWSDENSIARRLVRSALHNANPKKVASKRRTVADLPLEVELKASRDIVACLEESLTPEAHTAAEARSALLVLSHTLRSLGIAHWAAADVAYLWANTEVFFRLTYSQEDSHVSPMVELKDKSIMKVANQLRYPTGAEKKRTCLKKGHDILKKYYRNSFVWAQLMFWYKQTVLEPTNSLSHERRGCLTLPDPESAYSVWCSSGKYVETGERKRLFELLLRAPSTEWEHRAFKGWSFHNKHRVFGTPMFDDVLSKHRGAKVSKVESIVREMLELELPFFPGGVALPTEDITPLADLPIVQLRSNLIEEKEEEEEVEEEEEEEVEEMEEEAAPTDLQTRGGEDKNPDLILLQSNPPPRPPLPSFHSLFSQI